MKNSGYCLSLICLFISLCLYGCKDNAEESITEIFEIATEDLIQNFSKDAANVSISITTNLNVDNWEAKVTDKWLRATQFKNSLKISVDANIGSNRRTANVKVSSATKHYTITVTQYSASDIVIEEDIQVKPYAGKASEEETDPDRSIEHSFDDKFIADGGVPYHSKWGQSADFPVILEYYFEGNTDIDYFIYHTNSGNGTFGKFDVYTQTKENTEYVHQGSYDFNMRNSPSIASLKTPVKATKVKFEVHSGKNGYVSCDEMQFFKKNKKNTLEEQLLTVFTDITCSEIKPDVMQEQIEALPEFFIQTASALKDDSYNKWEKEFRIREYCPYSSADEWADKLMTRKYGDLDNPTGIYVNEGDEVVVLVGDTHGQSISIQNIGEETNKGYAQTSVNGDIYPLKEGVNKLTAKQTGMLFVMYNTNIQNPDAQPIKIHIPLGGGKVCGFFSLKEHQTNEKYKELIDKADYKYFCVIGNAIILYFHHKQLKAAVPYDILSSIELWDNMIQWQQELMGIEDVHPKQMNNHIFAISPEGGYMWASEGRIGFVYTVLGDILRKSYLMASRNSWGPAHEIGHVHQGAINWASTTESSNNLFSNYTIYKFGQNCSRGTELAVPEYAANVKKATLVFRRCVENKAWCDFGTDYQGEDPEMHARMNWQLWNYYHRCGYNPQFFPTLFKLMRENRVSTQDPGENQMMYARMACRAANENLTDFFERWGFFVPISMKVNQYATYNYIVTDAMIKETKEFMKQFPAPKHAFYYLEDRKKGDPGLDTTPPDVGYFTQFAEDMKITKQITYTISGHQVNVQNGEQAVAFEIKENDNLKYFGTSFQFEVPNTISPDRVKLYAVQADGVRIEMTRK
ncbi:M60 family metallopeptidase [Bacteroides caccae]|jgi:hypothetical protein|uniref:M60 family metallopeptidase n=1 Tax=Bacteroides caccae TaxID=47678 RepID=UPI0022E4AFC9|nr:M60 family metallopeptidase [Bacteroides caccae]